MGFFAGRPSFTRFRVEGPGPGQFGPEYLERLDQNAIGKQRVAKADGVEVGWTAGDHILDTTFELEKNVVAETLQFALRIDALKLPADLLRAYAAVELVVLAATNPSGIPSARQRKEARLTARERLEEEARDGRFLKRKVIPVLWDAPSNELLIASSSVNVIDRLRTLFEQTFGFKLDLLAAGRQAYRLSELRQQTRGVDDAAPSSFLPGLTPSELAWIADSSSRDFLGNEFLLWLWFQLDGDEDVVKLSDNTDVAVMLARTLVLECPRGMTGKESITSEGPTRLPEARRAIQAGKLPRKVGLTLVRHDTQYEVTLSAELLSVSGARLPAPEASEERARMEERVAQLRHLIETLDLLYDAFLKFRTSDLWTKELARVQKWLSWDERQRRNEAS
jgi:hypothetical protein